MEITLLIYFGKKYLHWMVLTTFGYMTYTFPCSCCGVLDLLIKLSYRNLLRYWWNTLMKYIAPILKVNSIVSLWFGYSLPAFYRCKFHQLGVHLFCFSHSVLHLTFADMALPREKIDRHVPSLLAPILECILRLAFQLPLNSKFTNRRSQSYTPATELGFTSLRMHECVIGLSWYSFLLLSRYCIFRCFSVLCSPILIDLFPMLLCMQLSVLIMRLMSTPHYRAAAFPSI
jgi:hypothetical protein